MVYSQQEHIAATSALPSLSAAAAPFWARNYGSNCSQRAWENGEKNLSEDWERYPTTQDLNKSQVKFTCNRPGPGPPFR